MEDTTSPLPTEFNSPYDRLLDVHVVEGSGERVVAVLDVTEKHFQPTGIVHGGVYASLVESTASIGASLAGQCVAVGVTNTTEFLKSVRGGSLRAEATPIHVGRSLQLWQVEVHDDQERRVATGRVRLMNLR